MIRALEILVFVITAGFGQICIYISASLGKYLRLRDLGVPLILTRRDALLWLPPPLIAAALASAPWYFLLIGFCGWIGLLALDVARPKPEPHAWNEKGLDAETSDRILSLIPNTKYEVVVASYSSALDLLRAME